MLDTAVLEIQQQKTFTYRNPHLLNNVNVHVFTKPFFKSFSTTGL